MRVGKTIVVENSVQGEGASMNITKEDVLRQIENFSETELRIIYTFIEEFQIAEAERNSNSLIDNYQQFYDK